jgi:glutathione S-transferase
VIQVQRTLYDLAGANPDVRFSPPCWAIKLSLKHKGLDFNTIPWRFTDKNVLEVSGQSRVPVLVDGEHEVHDSWQIALYLDETYPDKPLMKSDALRSAARFTKAWVDNTMQQATLLLILDDIYACIHEKDRDYFRESREKRFGKPIDQVCTDKQSQSVILDGILKPLGETLSNLEFLGGATPNYSDYVVFGRLQWARVVSRAPFAPTDTDGPIAAWFSRILDLYDGFAAKSPTVRNQS